ncbi:immunoglobulin-like domain-containing protein [Paenibacillus turpanensis]|uniref:immunoglobulin-like domain-containing protein n=1 Tax=Paenibacillus turpanensis TaxID=2689078 RepID=UPI003C7BF44E
MQDSTGGIYVYKPAIADTITIGDKVKVSGKNKNYNGEEEFDSGSTVTKLNEPNSPVTPKEIALSELDNHKGELITVKGAIVSDLASDRFMINAGGAKFTVYFKKYNVSIGSLKNGDTVTITGAVAVFSNTSQIYPRTSADITVTAEMTDADAVAADKAALTLGDTMEVIDNLTLPASGASGTVITWTSSNAAVISMDGVVTRPAKGQPNAVVMLTATITKGSVADQKLFQIIVLPEVLDELEIVREGDTLVKGRAKAGASVTVRTGADVLGNAAVDNTGTYSVEIPKQLAGTVLEITVSSADEADTVTYRLVLEPKPLPDTEAVQADKDVLTETVILGGNTALTEVTKMLSLVTSGSNGTSIAWTSSDPSAVGSTGAVTRPAMGQPDRTVTLTATIRKGAVSDTKTFTVIVLAHTVANPAMTIAEAKASASGTPVVVRGYLTSKTEKSNTNTVFVLSDTLGRTDFTANADTIQVPQSNSYYSDTALKDKLVNAELNSLVEIEGAIDAYNSKPSIEKITGVTILGGNTPVNQAPEAKNVSVTGTFRVGNTLTGHYEYIDAENDAEGQSIYAWYASGLKIEGATGITYVPTSEDVGKFIQFEVTPVAQTGSLNGMKVLGIETSEVRAQLPPQTGTISFNKTTYSFYEGPVITLNDADLDTRSNSQESVTVQVYSTADTNGIFVQLNELTADSGVFKGSFSIATDIPEGVTTVLKAVYGDTLTAVYVDAMNANGEVNQITTVTAATYEESSENVVNKTVLDAVIRSADELYDNAVEGSAVGEYESSRQLLYDAIIQAQIVLADENASQNDVDTAASALNNQIAIFNSGKVRITEGFTEYPGSTPKEWTLHSIATYTTSGNFGQSSPSLKFDSAGDFAESPEFTLSGEGTLSFWVKNQGSTNTSSFIIEGYRNGEWVTIQTLQVGTNLTNAAVVQSYSLPKETTKIRLTYNKSGNGNFSIDDIKIKG